MTDVLISVLLTSPPNHPIGTRFWEDVLGSIHQSSSLIRAHEALAYATEIDAMPVFRSPRLVIDVSMVAAPQIAQDEEEKEQFLCVFFGARLSRESEAKGALEELVQRLGAEKGLGLLSIECRAYQPHSPEALPKELLPTRKGTLLIVCMTPYPESDESFNEWYAEEHIPMLNAVPGWLSARRYVLLSSSYLATGTGEGARKAPKYLAVHELANDLVFQEKGYMAATSTPWRAETMAAVQEKQRSVMEYVGQLVDLGGGWMI